MVIVESTCGDHRSGYGPPGMILAAAEYAISESAKPPPELSDYFISEMFHSLPNGNGWKNEPARWLSRITIMVSVYNARKAFSNANKTLKGKQLVEWMKNNKSVIDTVKRLEDLKKAKNG